MMIETQTGFYTDNLTELWMIGHFIVMQSKVMLEINYCRRYKG